MRRLMGSLSLIILAGILLTVLFALYFKWEAGKKRAQRSLYESLANRFSLTIFTGTNLVGLPTLPALGGIYRGREVKVSSGVEHSEDLKEQARRFRQLSGSSGPKLRQVPKGEFTWIEVKCANPSNLGLYVIFGRSGAQGATEFERKFTVKFSEGAEGSGPVVLTEKLRRELLGTVNGQWLHSFETLTLIGQSLLYIETGRIKRAEQAERFGRMLDILCEMADNVDVNHTDQGAGMAATG
jgi:hypothetical protein